MSADVSSDAREALILIARRWVELGWQRGDAEGVLALYAPDFVDLGNPSGRQITFGGIETLRVRAGLIIERAGEWDGVSLLRQLGVLSG
jgi:hypothetical protein